jgi:DNA-directed RNA polymerase specialized sigma24 family protein
LHSYPPRSPSPDPANGRHAADELLARLTEEVTPIIRRQLQRSLYPAGPPRRGGEQELIEELFGEVMLRVIVRLRAFRETVQGWISTRPPADRLALRSDPLRLLSGELPARFGKQSISNLRAYVFSATERRAIEWVRESSPERGRLRLKLDYLHRRYTTRPHGHAFAAWIDDGARVFGPARSLGRPGEQGPRYRQLLEGGELFQREVDPALLPGLGSGEVPGHAELVRCVELLAAWLDAPVCLHDLSPAILALYGVSRVVTISLDAPGAGREEDAAPLELVSPEPPVHTRVVEGREQRRLLQQRLRRIWEAIGTLTPRGGPLFCSAIATTSGPCCACCIVLGWRA